MRTWRTIKREVVLDEGKFLKVEMHTVQLPDGRVVERWPWLAMPHYVNVVPVTTEGRFLFFRQPKYSVDGICLAPVGGYCEAGEDPAAAAKRELIEETGYQAAQWVALGSYPVDGNRGAGVAHLFLAREAVAVAPRSADDLEEQELLMLTRPEVEHALERGEFAVLAWTTVVALALRALDRSHKSM